MENINKSIRKHERAIKILEAYKESDRRYTRHAKKLQDNRLVTKWDGSWDTQRMIINFNIGLRLARMYENL
jgi:hypothetical protein